MPKQIAPTFTNIYANLDSKHSYFDEIPYYCDYLYAALRLFDFRFHSILDVGCGNGLTGDYIQSRWGSDVKTYIGYDIDDEVIQARQSHHYKTGGLLDIPNSRKFDVVICHSVLQYIGNLDLAFAKLAKLVKKRGVVSIAQTLTKEDYVLYKKHGNWTDQLAIKRPRRDYLLALTKHFDIISYGLLVPKGRFTKDPYTCDKMFMMTSKDFK